MVEAAKIDWKAFSWPRILFDEVIVANGVVSNLVSDRLRCGRDMLIDCIAVSEETFAAGVGVANASYLGDVNVDWWIHDRAHWAAQGVFPALLLDNATDTEHNNNPVVAATAGRGINVWDHPVKWLYNPSQSVSVEWLNPVSAAPTGNLGAVYGMHAVGVVTGHRREFHVLHTFATNAAGVTSGVASNTQTMGNPGDQPYLVNKFVWVPTDNAWTVLNDNRVTNHLRARVRPTGGDAWSDVPVPLVFYGLNRGQASRVAWYRPPGGPILLRKNQQVVFQLSHRNAGVGNINVQVALLGRVAPGYRDIS